MCKLKLGIIFGGMSTEHDISIVSGMSVIKNLDKTKYDMFPIYIDNLGNWYKVIDINEEYLMGDKIRNIEQIENVIEYLKQLDIVFPVLHGLFGEDGTIQGMLELLKIKYIGCKVLGSSIGMDKVYSKIIFDKALIKQAKYEYIKKDKDKYIYVEKNFDEKEYNIDDICKIIEQKINYPMFIKPSNSGSSVGINKAKDFEELKKYIQEASMFDKKILIEEMLVGKEIECSVLGNEKVESSCLGEIIPADEYYSFKAKYKNVESKLIIPAKLKSKDLENKVRETAIKAFKAIDGKGFARVDFFINEEKDEIYINEINTIPGFTEISMYPKLWKESGIEYSKLLDLLIQLSLQD